MVLSCQKESSQKEVFSTAEELFAAMKALNDNRWFQHYTFKQHTISFNTKGEKTDSALWLEAVSYPDLFRIDRDTIKGNYTIYRNDSTYHVLSDTIYSATSDPATHLLIKGGLYFISLEEMLCKMEKYGYNLNSFRKDRYKDVDVYVIGDEGNQFWLHATKYNLLKRVSTSKEGKVTEVIYDDFKPLGNGYVEQRVTFYYDGKKRLDEFYKDITIREYIDPAFYEIRSKF